MAAKPKNAGIAPQPTQPQPEPGAVAVAEQPQQEPIRIQVVATRVGWDGQQRRYPAGHDNRNAGMPFWINEKMLPKTKDGKIRRDSYGNIVLPAWVKPYNPNESVAEQPAKPDRTNRSSVNGVLI